MTRRDETRPESRSRVAPLFALWLLTTMFASCSPSDDGDHAATLVRRPKAPLDPPARPPATWYDPAATKHDFGLVLAGADVTRSHTFRITNVSDRPIRVRGVANRKPCCGDVAPVEPTVVEPGQALEAPITLKLGLGSGDLVHVAAIEVEGDDEGVTLYTTATAHARATIDEVEPSNGLLEPGQSRRVEYLIQSFGVESDPAQTLDDQAIRCELPTEWTGPATTETDSKLGIIGLRRVLAVTLPASSEPSHRLTTLEIRNGAGAVIGRRSIGWEVAAALTASPAGLVFGTAAQVGQQFKVIVRSRDNRPFRIAEAASNVAGLAVEIDDGTKPLHTITARFGGQLQPGSRTGEVVLRTDHPNQPVLKLAVYIPGQANGSLPAELSRSAP